MTTAISPSSADVITPMKEGSLAAETAIASRSSPSRSVGRINDSAGQSSSSAKKKHYEFPTNSSEGKKRFVRAGARTPSSASKLTPRTPPSSSNAGPQPRSRSQGRMGLSSRIPIKSPEESYVARIIPNVYSTRGGHKLSTAREITLVSKKEQCQVSPENDMPPPFSGQKNHNYFGAIMFRSGLG